jgi:hypothetical protein
VKMILQHAVAHAELVGDCDWSLVAEAIAAMVLLRVVSGQTVDASSSRQIIASWRSQCPVGKRLRRRRVLRTRAKGTNGEHSVGLLAKLVAVGAVTDTIGRGAVTSHGIDALLRFPRPVTELDLSGDPPQLVIADAKTLAVRAPIARARVPNFRGRARTRNTPAGNASRNARSLQCAGRQELRRGAHHRPEGGRCCQTIGPMRVSRGTACAFGSSTSGGMVVRRIGAESPSSSTVLGLRSAGRPPLHESRR